MRVEAFTCDVCGAMRKAANHWFLFVYGDRSLILEPWDGASAEAIKRADLHVCGNECVNKVVDKFLGGKKWSEEAP